MLGDDDDLAAVLSVLDQLATQLGSNREALDETCAAADELSGEIAAPRGALGADAAALRELRRERQDCEYVRQSLEFAVHKVAESKALLQELLETHARHELEFRCQAAQELMSWQQRVGAANDEYHELKSRSLSIDAQLVRLYEQLRAQQARPAGLARAARPAAPRS